MSVCYNKLWKLMIDRKMKKKDLYCLYYTRTVLRNKCRNVKRVLSKQKMDARFCAI